MIHHTYLVVIALSFLAQERKPDGAGLKPVDARTTIRVQGEVDTPLELGARDLASMSRRALLVKDHDGKVARYEGVPLGEILKKAGVNHGEPLRGAALTLFLVVEARDGYQVVFALPELDETFTDRVVLLADLRDGMPLVEREGLYRIVVPDEKKQARWVRQVTALTVRKHRSDAVGPTNRPR